MPSFAALLRRALLLRGWSQREFARRLGLAPYNSTISHAVTAKHIPRLSRGAQWADVLELTGEDRRQFLEALALANAPVEVQVLVRRLRAKVASLERKRVSHRH